MHSLFLSLGKCVRTLQEEQRYTRINETKLHTYIKRKYISLLIWIKLNISCSEFQSAAVQYTCTYVLWFIYSQWFIYSLNILTHMFFFVTFRVDTLNSDWHISLLLYLWKVRETKNNWVLRYSLSVIHHLESTLFMKGMQHWQNQSTSFWISHYPWTSLLLFRTWFTECGHN